MNQITPDGRYLVDRGQLCRCSNPSLKEDVRHSLVNELIAALREIKTAKASGDIEQLKSARRKVQASKVAHGERGLGNGGMAFLISIDTRSPILLMPTGSVHYHNHEDITKRIDSLSSVTFSENVRTKREFSRHRKN